MPEVSARGRGRDAKATWGYPMTAPTKAQNLCPTCGSAVRVHAGSEGTSTPERDRLASLLGKGCSRWVEGRFLCDFEDCSYPECTEPEATPEREGPEGEWPFDSVERGKEIADSLYAEGRFDESLEVARLAGRLDMAVARLRAAREATRPVGEDIVCPLCGDGGFDAYGLQLHYERAYCTVYLTLAPETEAGT